MNIGEFAEARGVKTDTIRKYISNHKKDFDGHTQIKEKKLEIDEVAQIMLDKVYPMPKPVQVIKGVPEEEHRQTLEKVIKLEEELLKVNMLKSQLELEQSQKELLIELKEKDKQILEEKNKTLESDLQAERLDNKELSEKVAELEKQLEEEKNKSWWTKLFKG